MTKRLRQMMQRRLGAGRGMALFGLAAATAALLPNNAVAQYPVVPQTQTNQQQQPPARTQTTVQPPQTVQPPFDPTQYPAALPGQYPVGPGAAPAAPGYPVGPVVYPPIGPSGPVLTAPAPKSTSSFAWDENARDTLIGAEDTVTLVALNADELSRPWRVSSQGDLNLPMLGRVKAAGRTVSELEADLQERMKRYFKDPQLTVYVSEYRSQPVNVVGAVEKPGAYQLQGPKSVFDAILMAGGPREPGPTVTLSRSQKAGKLDYPGVRLDDEKQVWVLELNTLDVMQGKGVSANIRLMAGDVVTVSNVKERKLVHIAGEVNHPGAVELVTRDTVSLLKVLAIAGGLTKTASPGKVMISRADQPGGQNNMAFVDLKRIMNGKAKDLELSAGHIIIVPSSSVMTVVQGASTSAVNTGILMLGRF